MRVYHEPLRVPAAWWLITAVTAFVLGAELAAALVWTLAKAGHAGLGWGLAAAGYVVLGLVLAALLAGWGRPAIEITGGELRAGRARLPLARAGEVSPLSPAQVRELRGPRTDPHAFVLTRPYLKGAVYIQLIGDPGGVPYWLVGTRRPAELAAAIEKSRPAARAGGAPVG
ncbi:MAG: DUF3093 domain-containing protein [Nocardiopsaceae bacterium]|jgi:hypothetical protein|nr:DUF3093 domain-containing protein [Nocardiopsaceae bacterium]